MLISSGTFIAFSLRPPSKVVRDDGTEVGVVHARTFLEEIKATLKSFKDWKLLIMVRQLHAANSPHADAFASDTRFPSSRMFSRVWRLGQWVPQQLADEVTALVHSCDFADPSWTRTADDP